MQQALDHRVVFICVASLLLASGLATAETVPLPRARPEGVQGEPVSTGQTASSSSCQDLCQVRRDLGSLPRVKVQSFSVHLA